VNATHLMATLSFQRAIPGGALGEGAAIAIAMVPFLLAPSVQLLRPAAPQAWHREDNDCERSQRRTTDARRHGYLETRCRGVVTVYLPLAIFVFVLLFPFYWMAITSVKPDRSCSTRATATRSGWWRPRSRTSRSCCSTPPIPSWLWNTMLVSVVATFLSLFASVLAAYAIERLRFRAPSRSGWRSSWPTWCRRRSCSSRWPRWCSARPVRHPLGADPDLPDLPDPVLHLAADGLLPLDPLRAGGMRADRRRHRWQILIKIVLPLAVPGLISAGIFAFTLSWNEFIYALTFISSSENKTVPVGVILTELVEGDVYHWGPLMAGALLGSLPVAIFYSFFVEYYVSGMTGAVKE
jgi:multiple sugar transport system permease protein